MRNFRYIFARLITRSFLALVVLLAAALLARAVEPWSDAALPVKGGVALWFDASKQNAARHARQLPDLNEGGAVDFWFDGSGHGIDLRQVIPEARPKYHENNHAAALEFDGKADYLDAGNLRTSLTNVTVFIHTAPRSNLGLFRGFFAMNQAGRNDYNTGLNLDLGGGGTPAFSYVNVEGAGCAGAKNLMTGKRDLEVFHTLSLVSESGTNGVRLFVDGEAAGKRERKDGVIRLDELTVGARHYSNDRAVASFVQGFLHGEIAELLVYDRALNDAERSRVEKYFAAKYAGLKLAAVPLEPGQTLLVTVTNPPPIQMLVPGFTVRELPVNLGNINNVRYRPDGKLLAQAYNGKIYLLTDTDGDGLEDKADLFWDKDTLHAPIGIALTPPGYALGDGVFVAAKGKVALIVDTNHDGIADQEITVATWTETSEQKGVDALGVAVDQEGNVFFGLGAASFRNGYLVDQNTGESHYRLASERGTIQKVSPDFKHRETVCTGIRFSVGMAFNAQGDLFCTDQEGATWLPNGNPLDELLYIETGRHYGFPPRHPKYLPNVIDEPSVFDYAPQHESTCGFGFNEPVNGGPVFGPGWWRGDALIVGESRGKLYRTQLIKTAAGYVAQNQLIGCLTMLAIDCCVSPQGDLVVACHSGAPDWGSGPNGTGKLYKISYTGKAVAQPIRAYAASATEMRVLFDRPLEAAQLKNLARRTSITRGKYVTAGERFETFRPGYQVVKDQQATPRYAVPVLSASVTPDARTLVFQTSPQREAASYALILPGLGRAKETGKGEFAQHPQIDLLTDLTGVAAEWRSQTGTNHWTGWLPHLDLTVAKAFTQVSADHELLRSLLKMPGKLTLRTQLDLWQMLHPAVQPGAKLDYSPPEETVTVVLTAPQPFEVKSSASVIKSTRANGRQEVTLTLASKENVWAPLEITLPTDNAEPQFAVSWHTAEDPRPRAFPVRRFLLPWAQPSSAKPAPETERLIPELAGGNWLRGQRFFFSDTVACYKCHQIRGRGGKVGPDLSNLIFRDYESVRKDIVYPSAALNPDHIAYNIVLKDGDSVTGIIQNDAAEEITLIDATAATITIPRAKIASIKASPISLMPEGLDKALGEAGMKDLLTFLLIAPLEPAPLEREGEPPARSLAEVEAVLKNSAPLPKELKPLHIVLCSGPKDHGPGEHDYPLWQKRWAKLLTFAEHVEVSTAEVWPSADQLRTADVIVFYSDNPAWDADHGKQLDAFLARGGGAAFLHYAVDGHKDVEALAQRIGFAWRAGASKFRHGPVELKLSSHPLAQGLGPLNFIDESYWNLVGGEKNIELLASGVEEGNAQPLMWTRQQGKGRVFVSIPGHYTWTFDDPLFRILILRGICWSANQPMDRLSELATVGARLAPTAPPQAKAK